jgi:hypothetical protein
MKSIINRRDRHAFLHGTIKFAALFLLFGAFFVSGARAQSENGSASLEGTVRDQNGAVIQGATVRVKNTETNLTRTVTTDSNGSFSVSVLPVGTYDVTTLLSERLFPEHQRANSNFRAVNRAFRRSASTTTRRAIYFLNSLGITKRKWLPAR